jgi:hypothetical protein
MRNGNSIDATCSYDLVIEALRDYRWAHKDDGYTFNFIVITLDY